MSAAGDAEILEWASLRNHAIVTFDADFHAILVLRNAAAPSVIRIRLQGLDGKAVAELLKPIISRYAAELTEGCMITVKRHKITCHLFAR
jgi:predicted nuclease of predicted toxin-antitoxin system